MILTEDLHRLINLCDGKFLFSSNEVISKAINGSKGTAIKVNNMETIFILKYDLVVFHDIYSQYQL